MRDSILERLPLFVASIVIAAIMAASMCLTWNEPKVRDIDEHTISVDEVRSNEQPKPTSILPRFPITTESNTTQRVDPSVNEVRNLLAQEWMAWAAFWMLVVTTIGVLFIFATLYYTRKASASTAQTLEEAKKTLDATRDSTRAYITTSEVTAWRVVPEEVNDDNAENIETPFQILCSVELINSGNTPALDVVTITAMGWLTEQEMRDWSPHASPDSRGVIGPGEKRYPNKRIWNGRTTGAEQLFENPHDHSATLIDEMEAQKKTIWIRGVVRYVDMIGKNWEHAFCYKLKEPTRLYRENPGKKLEFGLTAYSEFNELRSLD